MKKVSGQVSYKVHVQCPHCGAILDLNAHPYTSDCEFNIGDGEDLLGNEVFGDPDTPAAWKSFELEYKCYGCQGHFALTELEI